MSSRQKSRAAHNSLVSELYCTQCGRKMYVPRLVGQQREEEHTKHMYCYQCREITAHTEVRPYDVHMPNAYYIRRKIDIGLDKFDVFYSGQYMYEGVSHIDLYVVDPDADNRFVIFDLAEGIEEYKNVNLKAKEIRRVKRCLLPHMAEIVELAKEASRSCSADCDAENVETALIAGNIPL